MAKTLLLIDGDLALKDGDLVIVEEGSEEDCDCCGPSCCDEPGGPPTADFSYAQVGKNPCRVDFTDESTPGTCGSIVSYSWKKNGVEFSTASDPTNVTVATGDDIQLTVTDASGCTDDVVMEIVCVPCEEPGLCAGPDNDGCDEPLPASVQVTIPAWQDITADDCLCHLTAGTYNVPASGTPCLYQLFDILVYDEEAPCRNGYLAIEVYFSGPKWVVRVYFTPFTPFSLLNTHLSFEWDFTLADSDCETGMKVCHGTFINSTGPTRLFTTSGSVKCGLTVGGGHQVTLVV